MTSATAKCVPIESEIARRGIKLRRIGRERVGACARCGGDDRFSINTKKQVWNCRGCGRGGDVIDLVRHLDSADFSTACSTLTGSNTRPRVTPTIKPKAIVDEDDNSKRALRLWEDAAPIKGTLAELYLRSRGLQAPPGDEVLRFYSPCPFGKSTHPCMLALFRDIVTNEPRAIHRTALRPDGSKIDRMSLGPIGGCAIKLSPDDDVTIGLTIGEGIESTLAGMALGFKPAWALGSAGGIKSFHVLPGIEVLTVLVDHDEADTNGRQAGQEAAITCSHRWTSAGVEVRRVIPRRPGDDVADLLVKESAS